MTAVHMRYSPNCNEVCCLFVEFGYWSCRYWFHLYFYWANFSLWHKSTYNFLPACVSVPPPLNIRTKNECQKCSEWRNVYAIILLDKQYSMPDFFWTKKCILDTETCVQDYSQEIEMAAILKNFPDYKSFQVEMFQCYKGFWDSGLDLRLVL